jgi:hypothetical protein
MRWDAAGFVTALRERNATPHVAQNTSNRRSAIDGRSTRHPGYAISGRRRKRIEEIFGWTKATAGLRKENRHGLAVGPRRRPGASAIFTTRGAATRRTPRPPIRMRGSIAKGRVSRHSWPTWGT